MTCQGVEGKALTVVMSAGITLYGDRLAYQECMNTFSRGI